MSRARESAEDLSPGTVAFGEPCPHGYRTFERVLADGRVERGLAAPVREGLPPGAYAVLQTRSDGPDDSVQRVVSEIRFTARGPSTVSSNAYRSGWDAVFSRSRTEPN